MSGKRKAQDIAGGAKKKAKKPEPIVARWPAPPVDTFGWVTDVPHYSKIYKTLALTQYRLMHNHIKDLKYENRWHTNGDCYDYHRSYW